jgi:hypothetical protein
MTSAPVRHNLFPGRSVLINLLRTVHVAAMVGCGAGILTASPFADWKYYAYALLGSGMGILCLDRWANPEYFHQLDGLIVLVKLLLIATLMWLLGAVPAFWVVLVVSVLAAHAPGRLRHWRWSRN